MPIPPIPPLLALSSLSMIANNVTSLFRSNQSRYDGLALQRDRLSFEKENAELNFLYRAANDAHNRRHQLLLQENQQAFTKEIEAERQWHAEKLELVRQHHNAQMLEQKHRHDLEAFHQKQLHDLDLLDRQTDAQGKLKVLDNLLAHQRNIEQQHHAAYLRYLEQRGATPISVLQQHRHKTQHGIQRPVVLFNTHFDSDIKYFNPVQEAFNLLNRHNSNSGNYALVNDITRKNMDGEHARLLLSQELAQLPAMVIYAQMNGSSLDIRIQHTGIVKEHLAFDDDYIPYLATDEQDDFVAFTLKRSQIMEIKTQHNSTETLETALALIVAAQVQNLIDGYWMLQALPKPYTTTTLQLIDTNATDCLPENHRNELQQILQNAQNQFLQENAELQAKREEKRKIDEAAERKIQKQKPHKKQENAKKPNANTKPAKKNSDKQRTPSPRKKPPKKPEKEKKQNANAKPANKPKN
ncbi:MAG: hypothetical protein IPL35_14820 [Sphingobacteriales bacterium]|nr:hypothetical protein [Sphingobacteriales bacterium]